MLIKVTIASPDRHIAIYDCPGTIEVAAISMAVAAAKSTIEPEKTQAGAYRQVWEWVNTEEWPGVWVLYDPTDPDFAQWNRPSCGLKYTCAADAALDNEHTIRLWATPIESGVFWDAEIDD